VKNTVNPSAPTAPPMVENGPLAGSCTSSHNGTAVAIDAPATTTVNRAYMPFCGLRCDSDEVVSSTSAPPMSTSVGTRAIQRMPGVEICSISWASISRHRLRP
jgi:hypothetical protein